MKNVLISYCKIQEQGASTTVYAATSPGLENVGGLYFNNCSRSTPSKNAQDESLAQELWRLSEEMIEKSVAPSG
jgi:hypothetical protein